MHYSKQEGNTLSVKLIIGSGFSLSAEFNLAQKDQEAIFMITECSFFSV